MFGKSFDFHFKNDACQVQLVSQTWILYAKKTHNCESKQINWALSIKPSVYRNHFPGYQPVLWYAQAESHNIMFTQEAL